MDILNVIWALLGVGFLIFVHELGHFLAAKRVGVRVETFALGFQPTIFGFKARFCAFKRGETEYVIGMLPFGGYVKMAGEEPTDEKTGSADEFSSKKPGERALVLVAGAVMNLIFGFIFFIVAYSLGVPTRAPEVGLITPGGPAWESGIRTGDKVTAIQGEPVDEFTELVVNVLLGDRGEPLSVVVDRNGTEKTFQVSPALDPQRGMLSIGIQPAISNEIAAIADNSPAASVGLSPGDRVAGVTLEHGSTRLQIPTSAPASAWVPELEGFAINHPKGKIYLTVEGSDESPREVIVSLMEQPSEGGSPTRARSGLAMQARIIARVRPDAPANQFFKSNDEVTAINGVPIYIFDSWTVAEVAGGSESVVVQLASGTTHEIGTDDLVTWLLGGTDLQVTAVPISDSDPSDETPEPFLQVVGRVYPGSASEKAGLRPGDVIQTIDGNKIESFLDYREAVTIQPLTGIRSWFSDDPEPEPLSISIRRGEDLQTIVLTPTPFFGFHGIAMRPATRIKQAGIWGACVLGYRQTVNWSVRVFLTLKSLVKRDVSAKNLSGPVGIIMTTKASASQGFPMLLWLLALISVNLGIFNLLPFPILDGGHLTFLAIEKIKGSPVSDNVMHYSHLVAFVLLIGLAIFVTYHDIVRHFF